MWSWQHFKMELAVYSAPSYRLCLTSKLYDDYPRRAPFSPVIQSAALTYLARSYFGRVILPLACIAIVTGHVFDFFTSWTAFFIYLGLSFFLIVMVLQWVDVNVFRLLRQQSFEV